MKKLLLVLLFLINCMASANVNMKLNKRYGNYHVTTIISMIDDISSLYGTRLLNKQPETMRQTLMQLFINETVYGQVGSFNGYAYGICQIEQKTLEDVRKKHPNLVQYIEQDLKVDLSKSAKYYEDKPFESLLLATIILERKFIANDKVKAWNLNGNYHPWNIYKTLYNSNIGKANTKDTQKKINAFKKIFAFN